MKYLCFLVVLVTCIKLSVGNCFKFLFGFDYLFGSPWCGRNVDFVTFFGGGFFVWNESLFLVKEQ